MQAIQKDPSLLAVMMNPFALAQGFQGPEQPGLSNCVFVSYEQCQATASGRRLYCIPNPFFAGESDDPRAYRGRGRQPAPPPGFFGLFDD